ncbi:MAG: type II secretion system protein [Candidatus Paceibacterota bacterium]
MKNLSKGFSVIELIVAVFIFSIVMTISIGALLSMVDANRKARTLETVINEVNFSMESMLREVRLGTNYWCGYVWSASFPLVEETHGEDCENGGNRIGFLSQDTVNTITYYVDGGVIKRAENGVPSDVTSDNVTITRFDVYVFNARENRNDLQPLAVFVVEGETNFGNEKYQSTFSLQTSATPRKYDDDEL